LDLLARGALKAYKAYKDLLEIKVFKDLWDLWVEKVQLVKLAQLVQEVLLARLNYLIESQEIRTIPQIFTIGPAARYPT